MFYINMDSDSMKELLCSVVSALGLDIHYTIERKVDGEIVRRSGTIKADCVKANVGNEADNSSSGNIPNRINISVSPLTIYPRKSAWDRFKMFFTEADNDFNDLM